MSYGYTRAVFKEYTDSVKGEQGMMAVAGETLYFAQQGNPLQVGCDLRIRF